MALNPFDPKESIARALPQEFDLIGQAQGPRSVDADRAAHAGRNYLLGYIRLYPLKDAQQAAGSMALGSGPSY
jgi:hypothetical protein